MGSGWAEHAPFAFWLIDAYRPKTIVELGTHMGYSFGAFCQAVENLNIDTQCYAIDTWQGDVHAGRYGDVVYDELKAYVDGRYSGFAHMIRSTFDDALASFADGSIDLLHIDGRHFFEDVSHDFHSWIPKLKPNAIVLFHDTNVHERGFGVYKLWAELAQKHPHFEFLHGNGLGVLGMGSEFPPAVRDLFDAASGAAADGVRDSYSRLGAAASDHFEMTVFMTSEVAEARARRLEILLQEASKRAVQGAEREANAVKVIETLTTRADAAEHSLRVMQSSIAVRILSRLRGIVLRFPLVARVLRRILLLAWRMLRVLRGAARGALRGNPSDSLIAPRKEYSFADAAAIQFPNASEPVVSIVISTYGQADLTLACLASIAKFRPRCATEVLVVDDAFPDAAEASRLKAVSGIQLSRNETNLGFLLSCNRAAERANGKYLYFLNNDTELRPGAIDALVDRLEAHADVGMVGSKLLFPDGKLQEAGGIMWKDASGWNYGRGQDPALPEFNYVREVDYCSGASIMVRRDLFASLGGFDESFAPAYYEDVDLAFRIRARGLKVLYEPQSVVIHHEGMSHGTDLQQGVKAHQVVNQARMMERWGADLASNNFANGERVIRARDRAAARKLILVIDHYVPQPDQDAGSRSAMGIIDSLVDAGWVIKFWPHGRGYDDKYTPLLEQRGIEVLDNRAAGDLPTWMKQHGEELDHVLAIRPDVAAYAIPSLLGTTNATLSFYGVDLHFARMRRQAKLDGDAQGEVAAGRMERLERRVWRNFDVVIYPSEEEAAVVREISPGTVACGIVPFFFDQHPPHPSPPLGRTLLFVAGFAHAPNVDAARFLVDQILPELERKTGSLKVILAGSRPTAEVLALASPNVKVTGYISDIALDELYRSCRVAVAPLRFGAGVKGKVIEALSRGLPLVTTSIGAQGISGLAGIVPVHDDVVSLCDALAGLLTDDTAWITQSAAQRAFAQEFYSRDSMARSVLSALDHGRNERPAS
ncbi:glycosyltransferase [Tardiphaga sp. 37S4]|uniref:class I SAM-dependent methyltransferase n=1 Tax=Tardiphaga sp. 37S4 TaxID=1404741 RepID=UPI001E398218|nr:class I SAM-dependent methyltransferase [Tardiphaga sp. 37S4]UFS73440.1 glycosyltransferase [Tardiphaga sp. 37S4]